MKSTHKERTVKIMSEDEELEFAVAALLAPQLFSCMDLALGHVPRERARHLRRAKRLIKFLRRFDTQVRS